jgi:hypothetical protein
MLDLTIAWRLLLLTLLLAGLTWRFGESVGAVAAGVFLCSVTLAIVDDCGWEHRPNLPSDMGSR